MRGRYTVLITLGLSGVSPTTDPTGLWPSSYSHFAQRLFSVSAILRTAVDRPTQNKRADRVAVCWAALVYLRQGGLVLTRPTACHRQSAKGRAA